MKHVINRQSAKYMLTTKISVMTQGERDICVRFHLHMYTHTVSPSSGASSFRVVCQLCFEACGAFSWLRCHCSYLQRSVKKWELIHLSVHLPFPHSSLNSPALWVSPKCFPASQFKDERERDGVGQQQKRMKEESTKGEVVGGEGGR